MKLAILFWFYSEHEVCANHLEILRKHNPDTPIYGLYGGSPSEAHIYEDALGGMLDDFYVFTRHWEDRQKWFHGDLMIATWFRERGYLFSWDTLFIAQWDMLVLAPIKNLLPTLRRGQILLSGLRPIREVEMWWDWVSPAYPGQRAIFDAFMEHVTSRFNYSMEPLCCLFIVTCFPYEFLQRYAVLEKPDLGFLEYKIPTYAQLFGTPFCTDHDFKPWWHNEPGPVLSERKILNAVGLEIPEAVVQEHLARPSGARVFHPFREMFSDG